MIPGLPVFAIGRNPWIAWGGTNLRASASDMVDVSTLPAAAIRTRTEKIRVRWWRDRDITVRETPFGPILSDAPQLSDLGLPPTALHWTGHAASDEITAMLRVAGARSFEAFRDAFATFAVPGQNMLYADKDGNIGKLLAVRVPDRGGPPPDDIVLAPDEADATWSRLLSSLDLPYQFNPADGFLASANDRPTDSHAAVGYFFSPDDRVRRMAELMTANAAVGIGDLEALQRDVYLASSVALRDLLIDRMRELGITARASAAEAEVIARMAAWDGHYRADAAGPVAFELFRHAFTGALYENRFGETDWAAFANIGQIKTLMLDDISRTDSAILAPMLRGALAAAAAGIDAYPTWGDMHRLALRHPLQFLPVVGSRYRFVDVPIGGSTDTLMKTAHGLTDERHAASYGANARHISDLSDPDRNYFVLLGGQDGWLSSTTFLDQVPIWLDGDYVTMPLTPAAVERRFPHRMELRP
jgi:penicillin amidase